MQAVILAAGRGTRMGELTESVPKPMLVLNGKNLLQHKLDVLPREVDEVIMVVGYLGEKIKEFFGDNYQGRKIKYVTQEKLLGTGDALWQAKHLLKKRFMVMMGDDIYSEQDIVECAKHDWAILVKKSSGKATGGRVHIDEEGHITKIEEGSHEGNDLLISTAFYVMTPKIFDYPLVQIPGREEFGLPQTLVQAVAEIPIKVVESKMWLPLSSAGDLESAEKAVAKSLK